MRKLSEYAYKKYTEMLLSWRKNCCSKKAFANILIYVLWLLNVYKTAHSDVRVNKKLTVSNLMCSNMLQFAIFSRFFEKNKSFLFLIFFDTFTTQTSVGYAMALIRIFISIKTWHIWVAKCRLYELKNVSFPLRLSEEGR